MTVAALKKIGDRSHHPHPGDMDRVLARRPTAVKVCPRKALLLKRFAQGANP